MGLKIGKFKDLTGMKFGRLIVLNYFGKNKSGNSLWVCSCNCGKTTNPIIGSSLINGNTKSCGCYEKENLKIYQQKLKKYNKYETIDKITKVYLNNTDEYFICNKYIWEQDNVNSFCWVKNKGGYICTRLNNGKVVLFHKYITNTSKTEIIDHINGNMLDNRLENYRITTQCKNTWNSKTNKNNTSGTTGVAFSDNRWVAIIGYKNKRITLGRFNNYEDAVNARHEAELFYYGEHSALLSRNWNYEPITLEEILNNIK